MSLERRGSRKTRRERQNAQQRSKLIKRQLLIGSIAAAGLSIAVLLLKRSSLLDNKLEEAMEGKPTPTPISPTEQVHPNLLIIEQEVNLLGIKPSQKEQQLWTTKRSDHQGSSKSRSHNARSYAAIRKSIFQRCFALPEIPSSIKKSKSFTLPKK